MVWILLSSKKNEVESKQVIQNLIIDWVRSNIRKNNIRYKILFCDEFIVESSLSLIDEEDDFVLWNPFVAYNNMSLMKQYKNSIVLLEKPTVLIQKQSDVNPINENSAINNSFYILYIDPTKNDITNNDWKLVVHKDRYLISTEKLIELVTSDVNNIKNNVQQIQDTFADNNEIIKEQINLETNGE